MSYYTIRTHIKRPIELVAIKKLSVGLSYNLEFGQIKHIIQKYSPLLSNDPTHAQILDQGIDFVARKEKSLGNYLDPSLFRSGSVNTQSLTVLGYISKGTLNVALRNVSVVLTCYQVRMLFQATAEFSKLTNFIIVILHMKSVITCTACAKQYVGGAIQRLRDGFREHLEQIHKCCTTF